jgi:hypothetical protein
MLKMLKNKLATTFALVAALSLLLAPAANAAEGTTQGSFGAASSNPTVDFIQIYNTDDSVADSMTPLVTYYAKVTVSSPNKLKHLNEVKVTLFYNNSGNVNMVAPGTSNTQTCAILTCTIGSPPGYAIGWSIDPTGGGTTWQLVTGSCTSPADLNATTGDWKFYFIPGKVATEAAGTGAPGPDVWDAQGLATNRNSQTGELYRRGKLMDFYSEISVTGLVNWGDVPLGLIFQDETYNPRPATDNISINYIANGDYGSDIKSTDWSSGGETVILDETGGNPPASGEFSLMANATSDNTTAVVVKKATYTAMDESGTITPDVTGTTVSSNRLWLSLGATGILPGIYSGTIWYEVRSR